MEHQVGGLTKSSSENQVMEGTHYYTNDHPTLTLLTQPLSTEGCNELHINTAEHACGIHVTFKVCRPFKTSEEKQDELKTDGAFKS